MEIYDCAIYKFFPVKFRGDQTPVARQGHQAIVLNQYCIIMIGGSYQNSLVSPEPVPDNDLIWSYDIESGQWQKIKAKNAGAAEESAKGEKFDVVPWNLVYHTAFRINEWNIGVIWQDNFSTDQSQENKIMVSVFNCHRCLWRNLKLADVK